jgi:hypothetical protein
VAYSREVGENMGITPERASPATPVCDDAGPWTHPFPDADEYENDDGTVSKFCTACGVEGVFQPVGFMRSFRRLKR